MPSGPRPDLRTTTPSARGEQVTPHPAGSPTRDRRRHLRSRALLAAASGLAVLAAAGCSSSGGGGGTTPYAGTLTIAAVPGVDDAPLWLAQEKGLFAAAGLTSVRINDVSNDAAAVAEVANGQADVAASDYGNIFAYQASGKGTSNPLYLLADGYDAGTGNVEILAAPPVQHQVTITSPAELKGHTIGIPSQLTIDTSNASPSNAAPGTTVPLGDPSSLDAVAAADEISDYLLDVALAVKWQPMPQQQEVTELQHHQIVAALLTQPYVYQAEASFGAVELTDVFSGQTAGLPLSGYVAQASWAARNPTAVADFKAAIHSAQEDASAVGPIQQTLHSAVGMTQADADMVGLGTYPTETIDLEIQRVALLMKDAGVVKVNTPLFLNSLLATPHGS
jgi:NitT/TauT family transport system substrate-binding protein